MLTAQQVSLEMVLKKLKTPHGSWRATGQATTEWEGTCQQCGVVRPAVELVLRRLPFGRGEMWTCKPGETCEK